MLSFHPSQIGSGAGVGERATGIQIRKENLLVGIEDLGGLSHEVDAGENDDVGIRLRRLPCQSKRVAYIISNVLDVRLLVVMRQQDGILLLL